MSIMSPVDLEVLLHYYYCSDQMKTTPAVEGSLQKLRQNNLIERLHDEDPAKNSHRATERGKVYVEALCDMPLPVQSWAIPGK